MTLRSSLAVLVITLSTASCAATTYDTAITTQTPAPTTTVLPKGTAAQLLPELVKQVALTGQRGVALFFIVSAFTLFLSYDNRKDERNPTTNFFLRRLFRLAPMFYIAVFLTFLFLPIYFGRRRDVLLYLLFLNGFHPLAIGSSAAGGGATSCAR